MSRLLARVIRLVKIGAVAGAAVGVGRMVMQHRRRSQVDESSWPTIAETAAQNGQPVDDQSDEAAKAVAEDAEDAEGAGDTPAGDGDASGADDAEDTDKN